MIQDGSDAAAVAAAGEIVRAARTLSRLGLVTAFGHVSLRSGDDVLITPPVDLGQVLDHEILRLPLSTTTLPADVPGEAWIHLAAYRARPDVVAVVRALPESAFAVGAVTSRITPIHGQGAMLGDSVPVHDDARLMRSWDIARAVAATLGDSDAVVIRGNGAVTTGTTPGHAVARMWLLDVTCRLYLDARAAGHANALSADEIQTWRAATPPLLDRLWKHLQDNRLRN